MTEVNESNMTPEQIIEENLARKQAEEGESISKIKDELWRKIREDINAKAEALQKAYEEASDFDMDAHLIAFNRKEPFYGHILRILSKYPSLRIPTMGVTIHEGNPTFIWNPIFASKLGDNKVFGVLLHEMLHIVFGHVSHRRYEPHDIANIAADLAINSLIPKHNLPEGGLIPGEKMKPLSDEQKKNLTEVQIKAHEKFAEKIASLEKMRATEWYFSELMSDSDFKQSMEDMKSGSEGIQIGFDDHEGWDAMSEEDRERLKQDIVEAVRGAYKKCSNDNSWGSVSSEMRERIQTLISTQIDWKEVLKRFIGFTQRMGRKTSWAKLNKKMPGYAPGIARDMTSSIVIYIDQSGSVDDKSLELFFGELGNLTKNVNFTTFHFDTAVDEKSKQNWKKGSASPKSMRTRCGGTDFQAAVDHFNKKCLADYDGMIIFTDGYAPQPTNALKKTAWVLIPGTKLEFSIPSRDFEVRLSEGNGKASIL